MDPLMEETAGVETALGRFEQLIGAKDIFWMVRDSANTDMRLWEDWRGADDDDADGNHIHEEPRRMQV